MTFDERLDKIIPLHKEALKGNATAVQEANQLLERLRIDYPGNPLADAYHGSTMIFMARDSTKPLEKLRYSKNGLKLLDRAVAAAPQDGTIRLLRGKAAYALPEKYLHRTQTAIEDYTFLLDQELLEEGKLGTDNYTKITFELGEAYCRIGRNQDAARCWTKLEQQTQDPEFEQVLKQKLQSLEGRPAIEHIQANDSPQSLLIGGAVRAVGNALHKWVEEERKKEERHRLKEQKKREARRKTHKKKRRQ